LRWRNHQKRNPGNAYDWKKVVGWKKGKFSKHCLMGPKGEKRKKSLRPKAVWRREKKRSPRKARDLQKLTSLGGKKEKKPFL